MSLTKQQILAADDTKRACLKVPEWGGEVFVRVMSGTERDMFEAEVYGSADRNGSGKLNLRNVRAKLAALTLCDESGNRLFTDADIVELGKKSAAALDRVFTVAQHLNGFSDKDVEDLAKNSVSDRIA